MLHTSIDVLAVLLRVFAGYFVFIALFAFFRKPVFPRSQPKLRIACILAARNEEAVISAAVRSLQAQDYPSGLFDIYVIPNNCTDRTEEMARRAGARILSAPAGVRCKGDALHYAVETLLPEQYDAFCVFDADNTAAPDFLSRMNDALLSGADIAKGAMRVSNAGRSWVAGCYALYYTMMDFFYSRSRSNLGLSSRLAGTGFCVRRSVLEALGGWNTETITEDAEFSVQCVSNGFRVSFVPDAVTFDEAPESFRVSLRQRRRWTSGLMDVASRFSAKLVQGARQRGRRLRCLDQLMWVNTPFVQVASAALCVVSSATSGDFGELVSGAAGAVAAGYIGSFLLACFLVFLGGYSFPKMLRTVFLYPVFVASWLPLQLFSFFFRIRHWQVIRHVGFEAEKKHPAALLPPNADFS